MPVTAPLPAYTLARDVAPLTPPLRAALETILAAYTAGGSAGWSSPAPAPPSVTT